LAWQSSVVHICPKSDVGYTLYVGMEEVNRMSESMIETMNDQMVAMRGGKIIVMRPKLEMSPDEALRHAAWLIAVVGDEERFKEILQAVFNT
jgi:hypothetical protein